MTDTYLPHLYVLSGAGLSAESGIPTFRDSAGLWSQHSLDVVCNALTWKTNRTAVFEFYAMLRERYSDARPNPGHVELAQWQHRWGPDRVTLLTQNVDTLLEQAGATQVTHLHGDLGHLHCTACGTRWPAPLDEAQRCPKCDSLKGVKPGIVMFNEHAPEYAWLNRILKTLRPQDIVVFVGTAFQVLPPARLVPLRLAQHDHIVNVNPKREEDGFIGTHVVQNASTGLSWLHANRLQDWMS